MKKFIAALLLTLSVASLVATTDAMARRGADDPAGHDAGDVRGEGSGHQ